LQKLLWGKLMNLVRRKITVVLYIIAQIKQSTDYIYIFTCVGLAVYGHQSFPVNGEAQLIKHCGAEKTYSFLERK
jgi:hypothetical protein